MTASASPPSKMFSRNLKWFGRIVGQRSECHESGAGLVGELGLRILFDDLVVIDLRGGVVLALFVVLGDRPIAQRLLGMDFALRRDEPVALRPQFGAELGERLVDQLLGLLERAIVVAGPLVSAELGLNAEHVGVELMLALGIVLPQQRVRVVGVFVVVLDEVGVGGAHDRFVGYTARGDR